MLGAQRASMAIAITPNTIVRPKPFDVVEDAGFLVSSPVHSDGVSTAGPRNDSGVHRRVLFAHRLQRRVGLPVSHQPADFGRRLNHSLMRQKPSVDRSFVEPRTMHSKCDSAAPSPSVRGWPSRILTSAS